MSKITLKNDTAPATPESGKTEIFVDTVTKKIHSIDDTGTEIEYGSGGGGSGDVVGSIIAVDNNVAFFDGVTGKLIKDSGLALSGSNTGDQTSVTGNSGSTDALKSATTTVDVVSSTAPTVGQVLTATSDSAATWQDASGGGGLTPPVSSTDNAIVRWDGTGADTVQDSPVTIDDDGRIVQTGLGDSVLIGVGAGAVDDLTNNQNINIGTSAGLKNIAGVLNVFIGHLSGAKAKNGNSNTFVGGSTCSTGSDFTGSRTSGFGYHAFQDILGTSGDNSGFGNDVGKNCLAISRVTMFGAGCGTTTTNATDLLLIGYGINAPTATTSNYMSIADMITADTTTDVVDMANISLTNLPVYADEAAAVTGGLATDRVYKTATGELRIKL